MIREFIALSCAEKSYGGGIYKFETDGFSVKQEAYFATDLPMYNAFENNVMYTLLRAPFKDSSDSAVITLNLQSFKQIGQTISTKGEVGCHLSVLSGTIYAANYISGSIFSSGGQLVTHKGKGINLLRQDSAHCHFIGLAFGFIFVADLGLDTVFMYDYNLNYVSSAKVPLGYGARHLAFSKRENYIYCVNELVSSISVFKLVDKKLKYIDTVICPREKSGDNFAAAIRLIDDRLLIISNRGDDNLCLFSVDGDKIVFIKSISCNGHFPRDFNVSKDKKMLICANEKSHNLTFFKLNNFDIEYLFSYDGIKSPLAVDFI